MSRLEKDWRQPYVALRNSCQDERSATNTHHAGIDDLPSARARAFEQSQHDAQGAHEAAAPKVGQEIQWSIRVLAASAEFRQDTCTENQGT